MRPLWILLAIGGCSNPELEAANQALKDDVSKLTAENKRLDAEADAIQAKLRKLERELKAAAEAALKRELGIEEGGTLVADLETSKGTIRCTLLPDVAPQTVLNFVQLAEGGKTWTHPQTKEQTSAPLYDGTIFHRVIPNFMIQGGDPLGKGTGGPGYRFVDETSPDVTFDAPGLLAMANSGPNTNGSQFFITDRAKPTHLNGRHTIFGRCENLDVVEAIASVKRAPRDKPETDVVLKRVRIRR
jgi:peptidyl-prolyl cis-trans isomerase A (cyclophilin A)